MNVPTPLSSTKQRSNLFLSSMEENGCVSFVRYKIPFAKKSATLPSAFSRLPPPHKLAYLERRSFFLLPPLFFVSIPSFPPRYVVDTKAYAAQ